MDFKRWCRTPWSNFICILERVSLTPLIDTSLKVLTREHHASLRNDLNSILKMFILLFRSELDIDSKKWRLRADLLNDVAMTIELFLLPYYPKHSVYILCLTTMMRSLVGVAGMSSHFIIIKIISSFLFILKTIRRSNTVSNDIASCNKKQHGRCCGKRFGSRNLC